MEERKNIFDYVGQVFQVFGFTISVLSLFCLWFGEDANVYSTMFALGKRGLSVATLLQFFAVSVCITALRFFFFTDVILKKMSVVWRTTGMFASILLVMAGFVVVCDWFPTDMWEPWMMFFLCFAVSAGVSTAVTILRERMENRRMEEALERLKHEEEKR